MHVLLALGRSGGSVKLALLSRQAGKACPCFVFFSFPPPPHIFPSQQQCWHRRWNISCMTILPLLSIPLLFGLTYIKRIRLSNVKRKWQEVTQSGKTVSPCHSQGTIVTAGTSAEGKQFLSLGESTFLLKLFIYLFIYCMVLFMEALETKVQRETGL